jgi:hypothetical protein
MKSVTAFQPKRPQDSNEKLSYALLGPMSFIGLEEATQSIRKCLSTITCKSLTGKTLRIDREHFVIIILQKDSEIMKGMAKICL